MKRYQQVIACVLAVAVSAGVTGSYAYSHRTEAVATTTTSDDSKTEQTERQAGSGSAFKDETVYVLCSSDSSVKNIVVSDWLKNTEAVSSLADVSELSDIVNVKGSESFTQNGNTLSWAADGSDIYYKGYSDKSLPVTVTMTYLLDGKEVNPSDIEGKSGHLTIRWTYVNNQYTTKTINGESRKIYVPFMAASAVVLDTDKFQNVEVTGGKILSDGERLIAAGVAFPGLSESLGLDAYEDLDIDLPESFELNADVTDFTMSSSVTVVSNEIFSEMDLDRTDSLDDLKAQVKELSDAADALCDGTAALYDGTGQLLDGATELMMVSGHCTPVLKASAAAHPSSAAVLVNSVRAQKRCQTVRTVLQQDSGMPAAAPQHLWTDSVR
jgi:putative membrane protein